MRCWLLLVVLLLSGSSLTGAEPVKLVPVARVRHQPVHETSGIAVSRRYPGVLWIHSDAGDLARVFAIDLSGEVLFPDWMAERGYTTGLPQDEFRLYEGLEVFGASHIDWEDIAVDDDHLYLFDLGNNGNARKDLGIYVLKEPNPRAVHQARIAKWIPVAYPDQAEHPRSGPWEFDSGAGFVYQGKLYVLTKHRAAGRIDVPRSSTKLYRLDTTHTDRENVLTPVDRHEDLGGWVTAADVSPDGRCLAVLCQKPEQSVWLFPAPESGDRFLSQSPLRLVFQGGGVAAGVAFLDEHRLVVANEDQELFILEVDDFK